MRTFLRFAQNPVRFSFFNLLLDLLRPSAEYKGRVGERKVNVGIDRLLDQEIYRLVKDVTLPLGDGTTQIDHLVFSQYGIFIIETKNMEGWIFGNPNQDRWTQVLYEYRCRFQNPIRQNHTHVRTVQRLLGLEPRQVHNVVVFVGDCTFMTPMPEEVVYGVHDLAAFIRSKRIPVFAEDEVPRLVDSILDRRLEPGQGTDRAHVQNVRRQASDRTVDTSACPRCGELMVIRTNRRSGERFLGCKRYPRCRGTRPLP